MANTYTQLYIHLVFAVKNRDAVTCLPAGKKRLEWRIRKTVSSN